MTRHIAVVALLIIGSLAAWAGPATGGDKAQPWFGMGVRPQRHQGVHARVLLVERTVPGGPADHAGIRPGDIITKIGGRQIEFVDTLDMLLFLRDRKPGERMVFTVVRQGQPRDVVLTVALLPEGARDGWTRALEVARQERIAAQRAAQ